MKALEFRIFANRYEIALDEAALARLEGGPLALLAGAGGPLREGDLEAAIERAEDWLMPSSKLFGGLELHVRDDSGRLRAALGAPARLTPDHVERAFARMVDDVAFHRPADPSLAADLVLLRELVHHGRVPGVELD